MNVPIWRIIFIIIIWGHTKLSIIFLQKNIYNLKSFLVINNGGQGGIAGRNQQEGVAGPSGRNQEAHSEPIEIKAEDVKQEPRISHSRVVVTSASNAGRLLAVSIAATL